MKYFITIFACLVSFLQPLKAEGETAVEFRSAAFFHSGKLFRHIYGNVGPSYEIEASTQMCGCTEGWVNLDLFSKKGNVKGCGSSRINIYNVSLGPKYSFCVCDCLDFYLGIGVSFGRTYIHNRTCCSDKQSKFSVGAVFKSGINYYFCENIFIDLFCDYLYQRANFHKHVLIGGVKTGAGLGIRF